MRIFLNLKLCQFIAMYKNPQLFYPGEKNYYPNNVSLNMFKIFIIFVTKIVQNNSCLTSYTNQLIN